MNLARQELPGKGGNPYRVPERRLKALRHMSQSCLRDWAITSCIPGSSCRAKFMRSRRDKGCELLTGVKWIDPKIFFLASAVSSIFLPDFVLNNPLLSRFCPVSIPLSSR